jgi:hypothetical protein
MQYLYPGPAAPPSERSAQERTPGKIAFAVEGDKRLSARDVRIWVDGGDVVSDFLYGTLPPPTTRFSSRRQGDAIAFAFHWDPVAHPHLAVALETQWLTNRVANESCWLSGPGLTGAANRLANEEIGHPEWARGQMGDPLYQGSINVNYSGPTTVGVDAAASLPSPTDVSPVGWDCGGRHHADRNCAAFIVLEEPGGAEVRTRSLVLWSLVAGLLLAMFGDALIAVVRSFIEQHGDGPRGNRRESKPERNRPS